MTNALNALSCQAKTAAADLAKSLAAHGTVVKTERLRLDLALESGAKGFLQTGLFSGTKLKSDAICLAEVIASAATDADGLDGDVIDNDHEQAWIDIGDAIIKLDAAIAGA